MQILPLRPPTHTSKIQNGRKQHLACNKFHKTFFLLEMSFISCMNFSVFVYKTCAMLNGSVVMELTNSTK